VADRVIAASESSCDGAYVSVDTYPHAELLRIVSALAQAVEEDPAALIQSFGESLFGKLVVAYGHLLEDINDPFTLLEKLDGFVHFEVKKLEPEAELPEFHCDRTGSQSVTLTYNSSRALSDLAEGLLLGCFAHYRRPVRVRRQDRSEGAGTLVDFFIETVSVRDGD
jgi:hypothetical protein